MKKSEWYEMIHLKNILVTGGMGFIGSNFIRYMLKKHPEYNYINLDKLTYAGNPDNLKDVINKENYKFVKGDISDKNKSSKKSSILSGCFSFIKELAELLSFNFIRSTILRAVSLSFLAAWRRASQKRLELGLSANSFSWPERASV